ncbi:hypothetical protein [Microbacterium sp. P04]|uniref:hypothetical protein n=1 Tax=Microbacterium sp. P04 TaxID=3366947 RepID=UPI0037474CAE
MNDLSLPVRSRGRTEEEILRKVVEPGAQVSLFDRISLRLGLWLLLRSARRMRRVRLHADHARALEQAASLQNREHEQAWAAFTRPHSL